MNKLAILLGLGALLLVACSEKLESSPVFVFKSAPKAGIVASVAGVQITEDELYKGIETDLYEQEQKVYDLKFNQLKSIIIKKIVEKEPSAKGMSPEEYLEKNVLNNIKPNQSQVDAFIKERKIPKEHLNDQLKERINEFLSRDLKVKAVDNWLAKKTKSNKVEVYLTKPMRPHFDVKIGDAPFKGGANARVTVIEFSDFECPFCAKGKDVINEIHKKYGDKVKIAFKHFPLPFHKRAKGAALASMCVYDQSKAGFWKIHDAMFDNQKELDPAGIEKMVAKIGGVKLDQFKDCVKNGKYLSYINQNIEEGKNISVKSTPTFFVNGSIISGAQPIEVFEAEINKHL